MQFLQGHKNARYNTIGSKSDSFRKYIQFKFEYLMVIQEREELMIGNAFHNLGTR